MKKFFAIFTAVVLMPASQTLAWTGGPFSNNSPSVGGDDGVYEAIATMSNGVGLYRFAVRNNGVSSQTAGTTIGTASSNVQFNAGLLGVSSSNVWYYKGITYYGVAFGMANSDMGIVSAVGNASSNTGGVAAIANPVATGQFILPGINGQVIGNPAGNNIGYANSSWVAKMRDKGPSVRFSGRGQVSFVGAADVVSTVEAINPATVAANGVFTPVTTVGTAGTPSGNTVTNTGVSVASTVTSPGGGTFDNTQNARTSATSFNSSTRVGTGGEDAGFPQRGHVAKFLVFGTKVSHTVSP